MLEMKKYLQLHDYPSQVEVIISSYHLQGKATMWWDQLKQAKNLDDKIISWRQFKGYFQEKYLSKHYYERKMKEFFELKLGTMTMEEYKKRFFELLKYVDFIKVEKVKIQIFMSGLPSFYSDKIQYDNPKTLEETIRR
jgi:predicted AlkP superfamily phosphohydrolase/phosphomutase